MTGEEVFKHYRMYKFYCDGKYDLVKNQGRIRMPPLNDQRDQYFYRKLALRLSDEQIKALFTLGFFYNPGAHISVIDTPDNVQAAMKFAARAEGGKRVLEHDLYDLSKRLQYVDLDEWLYGTRMNGRRAAVPPVIMETFNKELPADLACVLLLVPRPEWEYNWSAVESGKPTVAAFGPLSSLARLRKLDQLIRLNRPEWRFHSQELSKEFWGNMGVTLKPYEEPVETVLDI